MTNRFPPLVALLVVGTILLNACSGVPNTAPSEPPEPTFPVLDTTPSVPGAPDQLKVGVVVFLTGGAAEPFGLPARNGAELFIDAINRGELPPPYDQPGIAGVPITVVYADESGGAETQTAEWQRLFD